MRHVRFMALAICSLLACFAMPSAAQAQTQPKFRTLDENGVDLVQGDLVVSFAEGSIGSGEGTLTLMRMISSPQSTGVSQWDRISLVATPTTKSVTVGFTTDTFPGAEARGSILTAGPAGYEYRTPDGTVIFFGYSAPASGGGTTNLCDGSGTQPSCIAYPNTITSPDGKTVSLTYEEFQNCVPVTPPGQFPDPSDPLDCTYTYDLTKVRNSYGYSITFEGTGALFFNEAVSLTTPQASISYAYPSSGIVDITDTGGRVWRVTANGTTVAIRRPGAPANTTSYTFASGKVTSVTNEGVTKTYSRSVVGSTATMTVTNPLSQQTVITSNLTVGRPTSVRDALNRTTSYQYDAGSRLTRVTQPEGNYTQFTYDGRGNITETRQVAKSGSGLADILTTAGFDAICANPKTCNEPNWTRDAKGNQTDYTYDATHGGVLTVTAPAPTTGATRPQTRYSYTLLNGEHRLTGVSQCQTGTAPSCLGTADETKATIGYDANGNVTTVTRANGTSTLTATETNS